MPAPEFKPYQVVFNPDGTVDSVAELPAEPEKKRVIVVRAETATQAEHMAEELYSLAK